MKPQLRILLILLLAAPSLLLAQPIQQQKVTINSATVFLAGAELSSTIKLSLPKGETDILLTNVAGNVNAQSLNIGADNGVVIQSAVFQNNYLADSALSPRAKTISDSIVVLEQLIEGTADRLQVIGEQLAILKENHKVGGENSGLSVAELQKMLDLINQRMSALLAEQRLIASKTSKVEQRLGLLRKQLEEEQRRAFQPGGQLLVKFYAPAAVVANVSLSYVVPNAGWTPSYDLRVDKINAPVKLFYKAAVYQNSGVAWTNVKVSLSTGNPAEGVEAPTLTPWYLSFYNQQLQLQQEGRGNAISLNRGFMPGSVSGQLNYSNSETYQWNGAPPHTSDEKSLNSYSSVDNAGVNTVFDIELPYNIPSDGQRHNIAVRDYELPATYRHFAVPKLDRDAFLQAQITKWEDLNLLPAVTNVFFEGSYVGQGYIDMRNVRDTMNLSLGRDKKIIIRRERNLAYQSEKTIGSNERRSYGYTISIRNTRPEPVHLVVLDQIPVSNDDDIVVENPEYGDAAYDKTTGGLRWTLDLKASQVQKLTMGYTIKSPKGKTVAGVR